MNVISTVISTVWNAISSVISTVVNVIKTIIQADFNLISSVINAVMNAIHSVISSVWNAISSVVSSVVNAIRSTVSSVFNAISSTISGVMNGIHSVISGVWNSISSTVSGVVNGIRGTISSVFGSLNGIVSGAMNAVHNTISGILNTIKGLFNFHLRFPDISIPHIPLPHFSISGSFNPLKGELPSIGINWYANGGIFTKPTLFAGGAGINGVGEAGPEAVLPLNAKTLAGIGKGVADNMNMGDVASRLDQLITLLAKQTPANNSQNVTMNVTWNGRDDIVKTMEKIGVQMKYNTRGALT
jgi:hypothetical protein